MRCSVEGIMYPKDAKSLLGAETLRSSAAGSAKSPVVEVPHASWSVCKAELDRILSSVAGLSPSHVFVLGPLHKGPVCYDSPCDVYAPEDGFLEGSDWKVPLQVPSVLTPFVTVSDDICSEEQSLEIIAPYIDLLFPGVPVCHLLASSDGPEVKKMASVIEKDFPNALVFISNNSETCCGRMWKEAFDGNRT